MTSVCKGRKVERNAVCAFMSHERDPPCPDITDVRVFFSFKLVSMSWFREVVKGELTLERDKHHKSLSTVGMKRLKTDDSHFPTQTQIR